MGEVICFQKSRETEESAFLGVGSQQMMEAGLSNKHYPTKLRVLSGNLTVLIS